MGDRWFRGPDSRRPKRSFCSPNQLRESPYRKKSGLLCWIATTVVTASNCPTSSPVVAGVAEMLAIRIALNYDKRLRSNLLRHTDRLLSYGQIH
jgi:hypothetical protein